MSKDLNKLKSTAFTQSVMNKYYEDAETANERGEFVAWTTGLMPSEVLYAAGFTVIFPENHSATCSVRRMNPMLQEGAENIGLSQEVCSYVRTDVGSRALGKGARGTLPKPDIVVCCNVTCQTVTKWYEDLADHFDCRISIIDMPFNFSGKITDHAVKYIVEQFGDLIKQIEEITGKPYDYEKLRECVELSSRAYKAWERCIAAGKHTPSPITNGDILVNMGPIVCLRGTQECVDVFERLADEFQERIDSGFEAAEGNQKYRVLWDNIPLWYAVGAMTRQLTELGVILVSATYFKHWIRDVDPDNPLESLARDFSEKIAFNVGLPTRLEMLCDMAKEFNVDGVMIHSNRSCKPDAMGIFDFQRKLMDESGIPSLIFEADHSDPRAYAAGVIDTRIEAFIEALDIRKSA